MVISDTSTVYWHAAPVIEANRRAFRGTAQERDDAFIAQMCRKCNPPTAPPPECVPPERVAPAVRYGSSLDDWDEDDVCPTPARPAKRMRLAAKTAVSRMAAATCVADMTPGGIPSKRRLCVKTAANGTHVAMK